MPVLSRFHGIAIRMYFQQAEHNPPHVHVLFGGKIAAVEIQTGNTLEGSLPSNAQSMVQEWIGLHREELLNIWETQNFHSIEPLK